MLISASRDSRVHADELDIMTDASGDGWIQYFYDAIEA